MAKGIVRKIAINGAVSCFGLLIALLVIEVSFRAVVSMQSKDRWSDRPKRYFKHEGSYTIQDFPYAEKKPEGVFRVAVVGDSFTFAPHMQFTDAFPHKLENMLSMRGSRLRAEVINYGVPAYSASHEVPVVKRAIEEGADLIILQITLNDPQIKQYRPTGLYIHPETGTYQPPKYENRIFVRWKSAFFILERLHNEKTHREYKEYHLNLFEDKRTWEHYENATAQMIKLAKTSDTKLVAVVFPLFGFPLDDKYPFITAHKKIKELFKRLNAPLLDLYDAYKGIPLDRIHVIVGDDRHPNEIAHRIAAEHIYDTLEELKYIPEELTIKEWFLERIDITKNRPFS